MGMYDKLICEILLPAQPRPPKCWMLQTKNTEAQLLERYTLLSGGFLSLWDSLGGAGGM